MNDSPIADRVRGIAALDHPLTLGAYRLLAERGEVSREAAADALDVARSVAAFHLDKLVDNGLADVRFERLTGRSGPGAGRTAKLYRRSANEIEVSLPERRYDLAGELLAQAVEHATTEGTPIDRALRDTATEAGRRIGLALSTETGGQAGRRKRQAALVRALDRHGYEPQLRGDEIALANCPFHALAEQHRTLVCGMNLDLLTGVIDGAGDADIDARLEPEPGYCCVRLHTT